MHPEINEYLADPEILAGSFAGTPDGVRDALGALRISLQRLNASDEEMTSAEIVVAEALNNVVEHALKDAESGSFQLELRKARDGLAVEIRDRGHAMPDGHAPIGELPDFPSSVLDLPEGGFGWFLIRQLAHELAYERVEGENRLTFRLAICS